MRLNISSTVLSLIVFTFLVFLNAIPHPFVHDDVVFIVQNPQIAHLDHLSDVFLHSSNVYLKSGINSYYRPILELVYRLEYHLFGFNAAGFHFINVLIHIANGLLLFALLTHLEFSKWFVYAISLIFLIHPVQTEAVACVAGISNLLSSFFVLLVLYFYIKDRYGLAVLSFIAALLTKEQVIIVPFLLILLDWYRNRKKQYGSWACFFLITFGFLWLRGLVTNSHMVEDILQSPGELRLRMLAIPRTLVMYLRLLVAPYDLHYYRNTDILASNAFGMITLGIILGALGWYIQKWRADSKGIIFGVTWFIVCLLPVLNITPLVNEYSFILTSEHFLYLPMVGVFVVFGIILKQFLLPQRLRLVLSGVFLVCGLLSVYQNSFWRGEIPLFERMIRFEPSFARGHILLANAYFSNRQVDLAMEHYRQALSIMQGYRQKSMNAKASRFYDGFIKEIDSSIAQCLMIKGQFQEALNYYKNALSIDAKDFSALNNMAICYIQLGDKEQAEEFLKMALGFNPSYTPARDNLNRLMQNN